MPPRPQCPGQRFALALMQVTLAQLLAFDVQLQAPLPAVSFDRATLAQRDGPVVAHVRQWARPATGVRAED